MSREYSGTYPALLSPLYYRNFVITATFFGHPDKIVYTFFCKETFVNTANIFWPLDDRKKGVLLYEFSACYSSLLWIVCCP